MNKFLQDFEKMCKIETGRLLFNNLHHEYDKPVFFWGRVFNINDKYWKVITDIRSWNNGLRCMSYYVLINIKYIIQLFKW